MIQRLRAIGPGPLFFSAFFAQSNLGDPTGRDYPNVHSGSLLDEATLQRAGGSEKTPNNCRERPVLKH